MSVAESVVEKLQTLTPEQQREVAELVDALAAKSNATKTPRRSLLGLCADLGIKITEEDIADARNEMWGNFPRDF
jgi:uncharacterized protein with von Willebrand factor type A (vWA) domain